MEFLLQIFLELLLNLVGEALTGVVLHTSSRFIRTRKTLNALLTLIMYLGLGVLVGFFSILIFPNYFVRSANPPGLVC